MRTLKKELWPYKVIVTEPAYDARRDVWLSDNLGVFKGRWNAVYFSNQTDFYFKNEQDAVLFSLRWS